MPLSRRAALRRLDPDPRPFLAQQQGLARAETQLVIGGVGDQLAQEDLAMAVQRVDHQLQQLPHLGLEAVGFAGGLRHR
jgi:hypothetical protein